MRYWVTGLVALCLTALAIWRTDGFSIASIKSPLLSTADPISFSTWEWPAQFRYLGRGRQMFAFESEDGAYVLKFFNQNNLETPWYVRLFGSTKEKKRWAEKIRIYPESYRLAIAHLPEETGLLHVHMGTSSSNYPSVTLIDKASARYTIDLSRVPFVLQKKGQGSFLKALIAAQEEGKIDAVIDAFLAFHAKRIGHHIADHDKDIKRNYCWEKNRPLYIDPARFFYEPRLSDSARCHLEWEKTTYRLRIWLSRHAPEAILILDEKLSKLGDLFEDQVDEVLDGKQLGLRTCKIVPNGL